VQGAFFEKYRITETVDHVLKRGESLWILTHRKYSVPVWLLRQYNPDLNVNEVWAGIKVTFPRVELRREAEPSDLPPAQQRANSAHINASAL
jgi:membrane-bound lytic murein transglycosylase D